MNEDCESAITDAKYGFISGALKETFTDNHLEQAQTTKVLDAIVTHRIWGYPIFFLFMYLMFEGTFVLGEYPMMGIESVSYTHLDVYKRQESSVRKEHGRERKLRHVR